MYRCGLLRKDELCKLERLYPLFDWKEHLARISKLVDADAAAVYVVYRGVDIVGELTVYYRTAESDGRWVPNSRVYLNAFRVDERYQNKQFGSTLLNYVLDSLYSRGYCEATIGVRYDNDRARKLYERFGFNKILAEYYDYVVLLRE